MATKNLTHKLGTGSLTLDAIKEASLDTAIEKTNSYIKYKSGKEEHFYQGNGTTSQGGDLWIANHGTLKSVMEFDLITVKGGSASGYVFHKYKNTNAHNIRLYDDKMVVQKGVAITYSAKITIFP